MCSSTNRFTSLTVLAALAVTLLTALSFGDASAQAAKAQMPYAVKFRKAISAAWSYSDTTTLNGAIQKRDTTAAFDARLVAADYQALTTGTTSVGNLARLNLVCSGLTGIDSIFVTVQGSPDGVNWVLNSTEISASLPSYSGATNVLSVLINNAPTSNSGGNVFLHPYWRFIVRPDGNTAALGSVSRAYVTVPVNVAVGGMDAPRGDLQY